MTGEEYKELRDQGEKLLTILLPDLNRISEEFVRPKESYRRKEDFDEMCVALVLMHRATSVQMKQAVEELIRWYTTHTSATPGGPTAPPPVEPPK
jgi:hypothetical protein